MLALIHFYARIADISTVNPYCQRFLSCVHLNLETVIKLNHLIWRSVHCLPSNKSSLHCVASNENRRLILMSRRTLTNRVTFPNILLFYTGSSGEIRWSGMYWCWCSVCPLYPGLIVLNGVSNAPWQSPTLHSIYW